MYPGARKKKAGNMQKHPAPLSLQYLHTAAYRTGTGNLWPKPLPAHWQAEIMYASVALQSTSTKYLTGNMKTLNIWSVDYLLSSNVIHILAVDLCIEMLDGLTADWLKQPFLPLYSSALCIALAFGLCGHPQLLQFINDMNIYPTIYFINYIKCQLLRWRHLGVIPPSATFAEIHWKRWPDSEHPSLARTAFPLPFIALPAMGVHRSK